MFNKSLCYLKSKVRNLIQSELFFHKKNLQRDLYTVPLLQLEQMNLMMHFKDLFNRDKNIINFKDINFSIFSQTNEDGILLYLFSILGTSNRFCLDIAFANPIGANSTNLLCNLGWKGLLICAEESEVKFSHYFFSQYPGLHPYEIKKSSIKILNKFITKENINTTLMKHGVPKEIDLFSLDIDGVDYWIWKNLDHTSPRVVLVEYNPFLGQEKALTVPYVENFKKTSDFLYGATLLAFNNLAKNKGYTLVGLNRYGFNAFFVRNDVLEIASILLEDLKYNINTNLMGDFIRKTNCSFNKEELIEV
jgi:hypothetical protein